MANFNIVVIFITLVHQLSSLKCPEPVRPHAVLNGLNLKDYFSIHLELEVKSCNTSNGTKDFLLILREFKLNEKSVGLASFQPYDVYSSPGDVRCKLHLSHDEWEGDKQHWRNPNVTAFSCYHPWLQCLVIRQSSLEACEWDNFTSKLSDVFSSAEVEDVMGSKSRRGLETDDSETIEVRGAYVVYGAIIVLIILVVVCCYFELCAFAKSSNNTTITAPVVAQAETGEII